MESKETSTDLNDQNESNKHRLDRSTASHSYTNLPLPYVAPASVDIGGSFTKMVYWRPISPPDLPSYVTRELETGEPKLPLKPDPSLIVQLTNVTGDPEGDLRFLKFPSNRTLDFIKFASETRLHLQYGPDKTKVLRATGGGAYKYAESVKEELGITFKQQDEMKCLIKGLNFMLCHVDNETFTYSFKDQTQNFSSRAQSKADDPNYPFPYLLVNIGSGVSILKVTGEDAFERVSGSSIGGGTFWGLCKLLTDIQSFDEVKELSRKGDNSNVDLMVGDIYGRDYEGLGLRADVIASSFGKAATRRDDLGTTPPEIKKEDVTRSLLFMISNNIAQIGYLNAQLHGLRRIYFAGGFLESNPYLWTRFSYSVDFWSKGEMQAHFLLHNAYLGAVGALINK